MYYFQSIILLATIKVAYTHVDDALGMPLIPKTPDKM